MNSNGSSETIAAVITPPGEGGIAAIRLAGRRSLTYLKNHFRNSKDSPKAESFKPFLMRFGLFVDSSENVIDEITAVYMPKGKSYTGEEQVEIFCHGGRVVVNKILEQLISSGARMAEPGEFSKLAFLNGKIDLAKAESVAEIIAANTTTSYETAREHLLGAYREHISLLREQLVDIIAETEASIDYPEEEIDPNEQSELIESLDSIIGSIKELLESYKGGRIISEGFKIAIAGRPNAGKSSLFNLFLKQERALVTATPGTTRDYLSEWVEIDGFKVNLVDTAGLRKSGGMIEKAGIASSKKIIAKADLVLWIFDSSKASAKKQLKDDIEKVDKYSQVLVGNKIDIKDNSKQYTDYDNFVPLSCVSGSGFKKLERVISKQINNQMPDLTSGVVVTSHRHKQKLTIALRELKNGRIKLINNESPELTALDLRLAINEIDEITGKIYNEDILGRIFSKFCVGK